MNALHVAQDALAQANMELIVNLAAKHRLPRFIPHENMPSPED